MTHIVIYIVIKLRYASKDNDYGVFDQPCQEKNCGVLGLILKDRLLFRKDGGPRPCHMTRGSHCNPAVFPLLAVPIPPALRRYALSRLRSQNSSWMIRSCAS